MVSARRAPVKPRVTTSETGETVLLEDLVYSLVDQGRGGVLELVGGRRTGKTFALQHLASLPFANRIVLVDDAGTRDLPAGPSDQLIVRATTCFVADPDRTHCKLASWCEDDLIEYLLTTHPDRCSSVMKRLTADIDRGILSGVPELFCIVAEQMACDDSIRDIRTALRKAIAQRLKDRQTLTLARSFAMASLLELQQFAQRRAWRLLRQGADRSLFGLLGLRTVQTLLAADHVISVLNRNSGYSFPAHQLPEILVSETARLAQEDPSSVRRLTELVKSDKPQYAPMAASVLHLADPQWQASQDCRHLAGAYLSHVNWPNINLPEADLERANLGCSDLRGANLKRARLVQANVSNSCLERANLVEVQARQADFSSSNLAHVDMRGGSFSSARFDGAVLDHAVACGANLRHATFRNASLQHADLMRCDFRGASLDEADLQETDLRGANLSELNLRNATLIGTDLSEANLSDCDLEFVELPGVRLKSANLTSASLTGSVLRGADLRQVKLARGELADIDWEDADLRDAILIGCTFHMGSSRSGLVDSPYPSEGTRTGFYTNDYDDQTYKTPEEIRKANLRGADLRGAIVAGVDFYLVDLRDAKYDPDQAEHFRRCDAILSDRKV